MELTKKSKVTGVIYLADEEFYALDLPFHMCDEMGNAIDGWAWKCVNSIPMNLDVLQLDESATPVYDEPIVVINVTNIVFGLKGIPKEVEYLNPEWKEGDDEEDEPTPEELMEVFSDGELAELSDATPKPICE